jgi:hypothetical protein
VCIRVGKVARDVELGAFVFGLGIKMAGRLLCTPYLNIVVSVVVAALVVPTRGLPHRCRRRCCHHARLSPVRGLPRHCSRRVRPLPGRGPEEGASPKCSGKDHLWSQAKESVV